MVPDFIIFIAAFISTSSTLWIGTKSGLATIIFTLLVLFQTFSVLFRNVIHILQKNELVYLEQT